MIHRNIDITNRDSNGYLLGTKSVSVVWECPKCGKPMGEPKRERFSEDGRFYNVHTWVNECGHIAKYEELNIDTDTFTTEEASQKALKWCEENPGWTRICDIDNYDDIHHRIYSTWEDVSSDEKEYWNDTYINGEEAWDEFTVKQCKIPYGYISGKGLFYKDVLEVPFLHNVMMVFKLDEINKL